MRKIFSKNSGFTFYEVLIISMIVAILAVISVPKISSYSFKNQVVQISANFKSLVVLSQSEALRLGRNVYICGASVNSVGYLYGCITNKSTDWSSGLVAYSDLSGSAYNKDSKIKFINFIGHKSDNATTATAMNGDVNIVGTSNVFMIDKSANLSQKQQFILSQKVYGKVVNSATIEIGLAGAVICKFANGDAC